MLSFGNVRIAAVKQKDVAKVSNESEIECEFFRRDGGCKQGSLCPNMHVRFSPTQEKCYNCGAYEHRKKNCVIDQKQPQQRATTERRDSQKPQVAQVSEISEESEKEGV